MKLETEYTMIDTENDLVIELSEIKNFLRIDDDHHDKMLEQIAKAVRQSAEKFLNLQLNKTLYLVKIKNILPPKFYPSFTPIIKLEEVSLVDAKGNKNLLCNDICQFNKDTIYVDKYYITHSAEIKYTTGSEEKKIPEAIKQGMLEHIAFLFDNRGFKSEIPNSALCFYQPFKHYRI